MYGISSLYLCLSVNLQKRSAIVHLIKCGYPQNHSLKQNKNTYSPFVKVCHRATAWKSKDPTLFFQFFSLSNLHYFVPLKQEGIFINLPTMSVQSLPLPCNTCIFSEFICPSPTLGSSWSICYHIAWLDAQPSFYFIVIQH